MLFLKRIGITFFVLREKRVCRVLYLSLSKIKRRAPRFSFPLPRPQTSRSEISFKNSCIARLLCLCFLIVKEIVRLACSPLKL